MECNFCATSESVRAQSVILPEQLKHVARVDSYGSKWTDELCETLCDSGVELFTCCESKNSTFPKNSLDTLNMKFGPYSDFR